MAARDSGDKRVQSTEPVIVNAVNFAINLRSHLCAGVILICYTVLTSPKKGETAVHGCNPTLSVSVVLVSRKVNFLRSISLVSFCSHMNPVRDTNCEPGLTVYCVERCCIPDITN